MLVPLAGAVYETPSGLLGSKPTDRYVHWPLLRQARYMTEGEGFEQ